MESLTNKVRDRGEFVEGEIQGLKVGKCSHKVREGADRVILQTKESQVDHFGYEQARERSRKLL